MSAKHARGRPSTPGRGAKSANQYFEPGLGRKTGIALKSTGTRDEYGLEPLSGIFSSSPASSRRQTQYNVDDTSAAMSGLDGPGQSPELTMRLRRSMPPARASTPRRSNITGSPQRHSSLKPERHVNIESPSLRRQAPIGRMLNLDNKHVRQSIEKWSPKKISSTRQQIFDDHVDGMTYSSDEGEVVYEPHRVNDLNSEEIDESITMANKILHGLSPSTPRVRDKGKAKVAMQKQADGSNEHVYVGSSSRKRARRAVEILSDEEEEPLNHTNGTVHASEARRSTSKRITTPSRTSFHDDHAADVQIDENYDQPLPLPESDHESDEGGEENDFGAVAEDHEPAAYEVQDNYDDYGGGEDYGEQRQSVAPSEQERSPRKKKSGKNGQKRARVVAPKQKRREKTVESDESGSESATARGPRLGSTVSNVRYRSTTPFEDAGQRTTRSGRPVMKPLNYWAGESVIWKNGEMDGIIRANSVEKVVEPIKRKPPSKKKRKRAPNLDDIDERDEDMLPSDWEEEVGVLTGDIAQFDHERGIGDDEELIREDIAFASSSIITKPVTGADFSYAKIQTLPWFGSGIVKIKPLGLKAPKNSRRMQMNFFVHKGKVEVTVSTPVLAHQSEPVSETTFSITEGGAWIVPRGNHYAIRNVSSTTTAMIFFSQGSEVEAGSMLSGPSS